IRAKLGERDAAVEAFRKARTADPLDRHGAAMHLMQLGAEPLSEMPFGYVQALFDQYAPRFETTLLNDLAYRAPSLLFKAVLAAIEKAGLKLALRQEASPRNEDNRPVAGLVVIATRT